MTEFTPFASAFGGALIGLAAVMLMATHGRIAGISGIGSSVLPPWAGKLDGNDLLWRLAFIAGLLVAPLVAPMLTGQAVQQEVNSNVAFMVFAGLITGFGAVYGGGCTSGHGVCGMSRISTRSFVATGTFMATAFVTVFIVRHIVGA